jgi:hypothetical protein
MEMNIKSFEEFRLLENRKSPSFGTFFVNEDATQTPSNPTPANPTSSPDQKGKEESYRSIAYKLSEILGLYGFFFAQKPGFMSPDNWKKYTSDIVKITDPTEKWKKIIDTVSEFQDKVSSPEILPVKGEFGYLGNYSYETETKELPLATKLLQDAHNAIFKTFNTEDQKKAIQILDDIISGTKALSLQ